MIHLKKSLTVHGSEQLQKLMIVKTKKRRVDKERFYREPGGCEREGQNLSKMVLELSV